VCIAITAFLVAVLMLAAILQLGILFNMPADVTVVFFSALAMSSLLATVPVGILWHLERRERASVWFFAAAFLLGGFVATALDIPFNTVFFKLLSSLRS